MDGYGYGAQPKRGISGTLYDRYQALLSGKLKPWELPEFKGMESRLQRIGALNRQGMGRQLTAAGVKGPALGLALEKGRETEMAPMGAAITGAYQQIPGQAMGVQSKEDAMYNAMQNRLLQAIMGRKQAHLGEEQIKIQKQQATSPCILATACYGENSIEVFFVRTWRDTVKSHPVAQRIIRGYYIFSDLLLPLMKFNFIKSVVKHALMRPIIFALLRYEGYRLKPWRIGLDQTVAYAALSLWKIMGTRKAYKRKSGQVV